MNKIAASITKIQSSDVINIVSFDVAGQRMKMMALELDEGLQVDSKVMIGVKATNIVLSKEQIETISISNQLEVKVVSVNMGTLLCSVRFALEDEEWESLISRESALKIGVEADKMAVALIKSSELSIVEIL